MVTSSVSPERAETMPPKPAWRAAVQAAFASVSVPRWLGLTSSVLAAPRRAASSTRPADVTSRSSPTTCTRSPWAAGEGGEAFPVVLAQRILHRHDRIAREPAADERRHACAVERPVLQRQPVAAAPPELARRHIQRDRDLLARPEARALDGAGQHVERGLVWCRNPARSRLRPPRHGAAPPPPSAARPRDRPRRSRRRPRGSWRHRAPSP